MREVRINKCMNGFIVNVGCQTLVFNDAEALLTDLAAYIADPVKVEADYKAKYGLVGGPVQEAGYAYGNAVDAARPSAPPTLAVVERAYSGGAEYRGALRG